MFEQTKRICDRFLEMGIPGFDLMVCKDGQCVLRYLGGYADPDAKLPVSGKEKYHIYSCSKLITCVAAMQLWEKGKFSLEDKLSDYIPAFGNMVVQTEKGLQKAQKPIQIYHLFEMTSGITYNLRDPDLRAFCEKSQYRCSTLEVVQQIAKLPLAFEPGERWLYGLSHDVLAALVEIWSGQAFQDYVKTHIFDPLGMIHTDFLHPMEDWEGFARQYNFNTSNGQFVPWKKNIYRVSKEYASGGAGAVSTVEDYMKFLEGLRQGKLLKPETVRMMTTNRLTTEQLKPFTGTPDGMGYGLGFRTPLENPERRDYGWGGAAGAVCGVDPELGMSFYYAQHVLTSPNKPLRRWLYRAIKADLLGKQIQVVEEIRPDDPTITY